MERTGSDWWRESSTTGLFAQFGCVSFDQYQKAVSNGDFEVQKSAILLGFGT
jgi:hypothetical protein